MVIYVRRYGNNEFGSSLKLSRNGVIRTPLPTAEGTAH